jgi:hypothetical protein
LTTSNSQWSILKTLRKSGGIYQTFQLQLLLPELLLQLAYLSLVRANLIEAALTGSAQINSENQYCRQAENNKSQTKWGPHSN